MNWVLQEVIMTKTELLQRSLYSIAKYDHETKDYIRYNQLLWSNIQGLDNEAIEEALIQLTEANL
jgi:hypothetical protein